MRSTLHGTQRLVVAVLLLSGLLAAVAFSQTGLGTVKGTVIDATGAAIPGAKITLTHQDTGAVRQSETSGVGIYELGALPLGRYTLTVEAAGFRKWETSFDLQAGQILSIDPQLEVGSVDTVVEVTGAAPIVTTVGMDVGDVKDAQRIRDLPLNGRFVTNLFTLTPGVEGGGNPRINGMKVGSAEMTLDGISLVDRFGGGMARVQPGLDTIQEFRIETTGSNARNSRPATITLVTKSGTNDLHGAVFWTHRNNFGGLRARRREDGNRASQYIRNEYGFSAGGPVIKNKTFWFTSYEGYRLRRARFARGTVPTLANWDGDFSNAITRAGDVITIYDPYSTRADGTRVPYPNNKIPASQMHPFRDGMRALTPDPAGPNADLNPFLGDNFEAFYPDQTDIGYFTVKGDHIFSERDNLSVRYSYNTRLAKIFGGRFGIPVPGSTDQGGSGLSDAKIHNGYVRWNHVFSPTMFNELQVSAHRSAKSSGTLANDVPWADKLGLPNPFGVTGWPTICASGNSPFGYRRWGCWDGDNRKDEMLTAYQLEDNVTWVKGKHSISFGVKLRWEHNNNIRELQQAQGSHSFGLDWTAQYDAAADDFTPFTGIGLASMMLGMPTYLSNQYNRGYFYFEQWETGLYFHDSYKIHPRLTLELGLRYDRWTPYKEKFNRLVNVDLTTYRDRFEVITPHDTRMEDIPGVPPSVLQSWANRGLTWRTANEAGFPGALLPTDNNNFAPRLGFAWRVTDKWVLRGGFGIYYWTMPLSQILQTSRTNPPLNLRFSNNIANKDGLVDFYALTNVPSDEDFVGNAEVPVEGIVRISSRARSMMPWDVRDWKDNHSRSWHFTIEREIMRNTALRLSYIGTQGRDLEQRFAINSRESEWNYQARTGQVRPSNPDLRRANPNWRFRAANHTGYSNNHLAQIEVERRFSDGLSFQIFYTFTRMLTTTDAGGFTSGNGNINATNGRYEVPENIQILGAPNMTYEERLRLGYINSASVPPHRVTWNGLYDLPFGQGKKWGTNISKGLNQLIGGWQVAFIGTWRSGYWRGVHPSRYLFGDPTLDPDERLEMTIFGRRQRLWFRGDFDPTRATDVDQAKLQQLVPVDRGKRVLRPLGPNFDNRMPQVLADGTVRMTRITDNVNWNARNFFLGPGFWNLDFSVFKNFIFTETKRLRFTADFFNVFNHPNDVNPNSRTGLQDLSRQANEPRIIQFSLRFEW